MVESRRWGPVDWAALVLVVAIAAGARCWYVAACTDGGNRPAALEVQGGGIFSPPSKKDGISQANVSNLDDLVQSLLDQQGFEAKAPLADKTEPTAHVAPAYPWLVSLVGRLEMPRDAALRWGQAVLGTLTALCYFCFARRAFQSLMVGLLAGLFAAIHPFWVINTAELNDGVLATFLLAAILALGTLAVQAGGPFLSLLFGLTLAGLAMTRAALLPFTLVALLWFLLSCRTIRAGWLCALLACLGFGNGLAPWAVRNYRAFGEVIPVADSAMLHLWEGNNPKATGGPMDETALRASLPAKRLETLLADTNQATRYASLGQEVIRAAVDQPGAALDRRLHAGVLFIFGDSWLTDKKLARSAPDSVAASSPQWVIDDAPGALAAALFVMLVAGLLGWRFSFGWRKEARLATLAAIWVPLPYILSHADSLSGPRLPVDGVWLCFAAFAICCGMPGIRRAPKED